MRPDTVAWLARVRANAAVPGTIFVTIAGKSGSVAIPPEDIVGKSDDELLAFIARRLTEQ